MSRVGKLPINIPKGVSATLEGLVLTVKGPKGTLARQLPETLDVKIDTATIQIQRRDDTIQSRSLHGLARALVNNMVLGVSEGFKRSLEIQGTGYRAETQQKGALNLNLGFSHPIQFPLPDGIQATVERQNIIHLEGIDRELLGQTAARIKAIRPVEPYKGKGVRNVGEHIHRKAGKTGSKK